MQEKGNLLYEKLGIQPLTFIPTRKSISGQ